MPPKTKGKGKEKATRPEEQIVEELLEVAPVSKQHLSTHHSLNR